MYRVLAVSVVFLIAACAGPNVSKNTRNLQLSQGVIALLNSDESITLADPRIHCEQRKVIGSNFRSRMCTLSTEHDAAREDSLRDALGAGHDRHGEMGFKNTDG